jgi:hypothetical protein
MSNGVPDDYRELQKWASNQAFDGINGNSSKQELQEAYKEHELNAEEPEEETVTESDSSDSEDIEMELKPSKDAPQGETMFDAEEVELEADSKEKQEKGEEETPETDPETPADDGEKGVETGNTEPVSGGVELSETEVKELHRQVNEVMVFASQFLEWNVMKFDDKRLDEIAKTSKNAVNRLVPDRFKEDTGKGIGFMSAVNPHIQALVMGNIDRLNESGGTEEGSNTEKSDSTSEMEDDEVLESLE